MISSKSSVEIVIIKGTFSGLGSLLVALVLGETFPQMVYLLCTMVLGFVAYGLSINFYIMAQKDLGAAKTSAFYSVAPFLGVAFSMLLLGERPGLQFYAALAVMLAATVLLVRDSVTLQHTHEHSHTHTHEHCHGELVHTHEHEHRHIPLHVHGEDTALHSHSHKDLHGHRHAHGLS